MKTWKLVFAHLLTTKSFNCVPFDYRIPKQPISQRRFLLTITISPNIIVSQQILPKRMKVSIILNPVLLAALSSAQLLSSLAGAASGLTSVVASAASGVVASVTNGAGSVGTGLASSLSSGNYLCLSLTSYDLDC